MSRPDRILYPFAALDTLIENIRRSRYEAPQASKPFVPRRSSRIAEKPKVDYTEGINSKSEENKKLLDALKKYCQKYNYVYTPALYNALLLWVGDELDTSPTTKVTTFISAQKKAIVL